MNNVPINNGWMKSMIKRSICIKQQAVINLQIKNDPFQYKLSSCLSATMVAAVINCKTFFFEFSIIA